MAKRAASYSVIVGGHICLDIIPSIQGGPFQMVPGKLLNIGEAALSTGGAVANTGLALHRLGIPVQLMGKVGNDFFGEAILSILKKQHESLAEGMIVAEGEPSSYSIVINPPHVDRMFLHCTGANDTFQADDITAEALQEAGLFHFGYPPLMRRMYEHGGAELSRLMQKAKEAGATTSMDMAKPDPDAKAGQLDWRLLLADVLPYVDLFLPSIEEILYMLRRETYEAMKESHGSEQLIEHVEASLLAELSSELLAMGAAIVVFKLGEHGLYMRTTSEAARLESTGRCGPKENAAGWLNRELYVPCFKVEVVGTTGAGDCTIAGFLAGFLQGLQPEETLLGAVGTGACNVERPDAVSGIPTWAVVQARIAAGWESYPPKPAFAGARIPLPMNTAVWQGTRDLGTTNESVKGAKKL
ncbi:carbohydrate kinase family protein [Paenibacillus luteus]|uniref:carbohydrate kinase family protein n=1 Tax=Paenibacillus luteus TaxID=2545753 RepID=UPI001F5035CB|nr:carbohydrate kinase family protein [Paenibacillus luteus]